MVDSASPPDAAADSVVAPDTSVADSGVADATEDTAEPMRANACEACEVDDDCESRHCVSLVTGGNACLPGCNIDLPDCPRGLTCTIEPVLGEALCIPIGGPCCLDEDADEHGVGVGCLGADCDDADESVFVGATEVCDGIDNDCDEVVDGEMTDCSTGRCSATGSGTYSAVESAMCVDAGCVSGTLTDCALFTCVGGGEDGVVCATSCDVGGGDDEAYCVLAAHCDDGVCASDEPNGSVCDEDSDCVAGHCDNGFCCDGGTCCSVSDDCPGAGGVGIVCDDPRACQGTRGELSCEDNVCGTVSGIPDDSACDDATLSTDCGLWDPVFCAGGLDQTMPVCPTSCVSDTECVEGAHCETGVCSPDRGPGGFCGRQPECQAGLFCVDGRCCGSACEGSCEACDVAGMEGTCSFIPVTADPAGECPGFSCDSYYDTFDGLGRCFRRRAVTDSAAGCNGAGACVGPDFLCPMQPAGDIQIDCDDSCQSPTAGTCTGVIPGSCDDLDDAGDILSCGLGVCAATQQRCVGGAPQTCTPGASSDEACNGLDDDCDGVADDGVSSVLCPPAPNVSATACTAGSCELVACDPLLGNCDMNDVNGCERPLVTATDCGSCGNVCSLPNATPTCPGGTCLVAVCDAGFGDCDGADPNGCEVRLNTASNCAGCGVGCDLPNATQSCASGTCRLTTCAPGFGNCDGGELNGCETSLNTLANCGGCSVGCDLPNASDTCTTGSCRIDTCNPGFGDCDATQSTGCETSLTTAANCGSCGNPCSLDHASETCGAGVCVLLACDAGWGNCDGMMSNGCETDLRTAANCGGCGTICDLANATESCATGSCTLGTCDTDFGDCDGNPATGCETPLTTLTNCASCGTTCDIPGAGESCATGTCLSSSCDSGLADCDGLSGNGCETSLDTLTDCGGCGTICDLPNAVESCSTETCQLVSCLPGFANCDGLDSNGCETPLNTLSNCGSCGVGCALPNGTESCAGGVCVLTGCDPLRGNCDGLDFNGCEVSLETLSSCGSCGVACDVPNASDTCSGGTCAIDVCSSGFDNCDGVTGTGCETNLRTLADCGSCGSMCDFPNAAESCSTGTCSLGSCTAGFGNCDGMTPNGCEQTLTTLDHCAACGVACSLSNGSESCAGGACVLTGCDAGFFDVDGDDGTGCECADEGTGNDCPGALSLGGVGVGGSISQVGKVIGAGTSDWYRVDFPPVDPLIGGGVARITFSVGTPANFRFEIQTSCGTTMSCGSGGTATSHTDWTFTDDASIGFTSRTTAWPSGVFIRVFRIDGGDSCADYTLNITR